MEEKGKTEWDRTLKVKSCKMGDKEEGEVYRSLKREQAEEKLSVFLKERYTWAVIERKADDKVGYDAREVPRGAPKRIESDGEELRIRKTCDDRREAEQEATRLQAKAEAKGNALPPKAPESDGKRRGRNRRSAYQDDSE